MWRLQEGAYALARIQARTSPKQALHYMLAAYMASGTWPDMRLLRLDRRRRPALPMSGSCARPNHHADT